MCGFAGIVDLEAGSVSRDQLEALAATVTHRGPDESGSWIDGACGLAHRRLSIVDLSASRQPMAPEDSNLALVYNGELYNYQELRRELSQSGVTLNTSGDTEVLLRWVARQWADALPRFDGMFAFAAWDRNSQRLLLARDAIGEKPLFFATPRRGLIIFGSEIKAVLAHPEVDGNLDEDSLRQAVRFRTVYGPRTLYKGVQQLPPGSSLEFARDGHRVVSYFDLIAEARRVSNSISHLSSDELVKYGSDLLTDSVRERLMADVPLGVFLSGGLDSSLIAATMRQLNPGGTIRTFSVGFEGDAHSELAYAKQVAHAIGAAHHEVAVGPKEFQSRMATLSVYRDGPVSEPADVAIAALSRFAKQQVKVVLSGEGADEAFGGYPKYSLARLPAAAGWPISFVGAERFAQLAGMLGLDRRRTMVAAKSLAMPREHDRLAQWFSYFDRANLLMVLPHLGWTSDDWTTTAALQSDVLRRSRGLSRIARMQAVDCLSWLPGNMLERGDRMTMSEGLELRPPFLDKELVAFGLALPDRMKVRGKWTKWIVRKWGTDRLPKTIRNRPKWGFRVPLAEWFRGPLRAMLHDNLLAGSGFCATYGDRKAITQLLDRHDRGEIDANLTLWGLLSTEVWYQAAFARQRRAA